MRVSDYYELERAQPSLDFVDVELKKDIPLFVEPYALLDLQSAWGNKLVHLVQSFFVEVLDALKTNDENRGLRLLSPLHEPRETRLGVSVGSFDGRAVGNELAVDMWQALRTSSAARSGLLEDLEDTILMIPGIGPDIISDITTNLIREELIKYTADMCTLFGIPLQDDVDSGSLWNSTGKRWFNRYVQLPVVNGEKLLLVPKRIVRRRPHYNVDQYYSQYILEHLRQEELRKNSSLVHVLQGGRRKVYKKDLRKKYGSGKKVVIDQTLRTPRLLEQYKQDRKNIPSAPLNHNDIESVFDLPDYDFDAAYKELCAIPTGDKHARVYQEAVEKLLTSIFYPSLTYPIFEHRLHGGRKRVDIKYTNEASSGFFNYLALHFRCPMVFVECKNYEGQVANPELDQLSGRFSPTRGNIGILTCRKFPNRTLFQKKCRDTAVDQRGYILTLDDADIAALIEERKGLPNPTFNIFRAQLDYLLS